jgi:hypothetical protein
MAKHRHRRSLREVLRRGGEPAVLEQEITVTVQLAREHGCARAVPGVATVVLAPRVVQQPEREHDLRIGARLGRQVESRRRNCKPVRLAVQPRAAAPRLGENPSATR